MAIALEVRNVTRRLQGEVPVTLVNDASLAISAGECVAITGPSGSGKSSLLYLLGLLDTPSSGRIWLDGRETTGLSEDALADVRLARLGFVFQSHFLLPEFSALENVRLPMDRLARLTLDEREKRATELLTSLGLAAEVQKLPKQLSGGQSQRVAIARALANDPTLIFADEPTGNLDTASSEAVQSLIIDLAHKRGRAVVVVTHDAGFAARADRVIRVVDGRIVA